MDDLIVIILTLVIVVVGAIGQIKKKNLPQPEGKSQNSPTDFWSLLTGTEEVMAENQTAEIIEPETICRCTQKKTLKAR